MSSRANHFKLGVFVITGVLLALFSLLLLGIGNNLKRPLLLETYLDQSVQGLAIGSQVKYRGVDLGKVHFIGFSRDRYEYGKPITEQRRYLLIEVAVDDQLYAMHGKDDFLELLRTEVARGLRFRLNAQGITGLSYLELDYVNPEANPPLAISWTPENPYIPSAPGTLTKLLSAAENVFRKLEAMNLDLVLTNLNKVLVTAEGEIRRADLAKVTTEAKQLLTDLRTSNEHLQKLLADPKLQGIPEQASGILADLQAKVRALDLEGTLRRVDRTLETAEAFLAGKEGDLATTLTNLRALSDNLRAISERVGSHPAALLLGAPPKPIQPTP